MGMAMSRKKGGAKKSVAVFDPVNISWQWKIKYVIIVAR